MGDPACEEYKLPRWAEVLIVIVSLVGLLAGFSCYVN